MAVRPGIGNGESGIGKAGKHRLFALPIPDSPFPIPGRATRANGFTLLEMLAVILLIGVATAAVAFSVTQGLAGARAAAASADLAAALRATRAQAIVRGKAQVFDLDTRDNRWRNARGQTVQLPPDMKLSITSAREDAPDDHTGRIRFFPDGSSTGGNIIVQRGERQWRIDVAWLTGAVVVR